MIEKIAAFIKILIALLTLFRKPKPKPPVKEEENKPGEGHNFL